MAQVDVTTNMPMSQDNVEEHEGNPTGPFQQPPLGNNKGFHKDVRRALIVRAWQQPEFSYICLDQWVEQLQRDKGLQKEICNVSKHYVV